MFFPYDHQHGFQNAISKAKANENYQEHVVGVTETWMTVGALLAGCDLAMLALCVGIPPDERSLFDQLLVLTSAVGTLLSLCGPVTLGGVLMINARAVNVVNFDLYMVISRDSFALNERLICLFNIANALAFLCLVFVINTPRSQLPPSMLWLSSLFASSVIATMLAGLITLVIWHINAVSFVTSRSGIFSSKRACAVAAEVEASDFTVKQMRKISDDLVDKATGTTGRLLSRRRTSIVSYNAAAARNGDAKKYRATKLDNKLSADGRLSA